MAWQHHARLAWIAVALGWAILTFTVWRLYPDQPPARLLACIGLGLSAWGLLWFGMDFLHRRFGAQDLEEENPMGMAERIRRRSGWGALWIAALAMLFLERALRWEWALLFGALLLGAELLWMATEPPPERGPHPMGGRGSHRR